MTQTGPRAAATGVNPLHTTPARSAILQEWSFVLGLGDRMIRRRDFITLVGGAAVWPLAARAQQQTGKVWRIGMLETAPQDVSAANLAAFQKGLQELGYVVGRNLVIEYRSSDGHNEHLPDLASELVRLNVDLIVLRGTPQALAAKKATGTIPIVMANVADPVGAGIVASLANPGGNITGSSSFVTELEGKRVELLKEMVPGVKRLATIRDFSNPATTAQWEAEQAAARALAVEIRRFDVRDTVNVIRAFEAAIDEKVEALIVGVDTVTSTNQQQIVDLAARYKLPAIYQDGVFADDGGLVSYGVNYPELYYRAAIFVDKIFKGVRPADIPVEQPSKLELIINLKTAKALGLAVPPTLLALADEVIE
jgi:putative tryptophan/tyrosine transport system substrate-binding protein